MQKDREMFEMPKDGTWEVRGGWVARRLIDDINWPLNSAAGFVGNLGFESAEFKTLQEVKPQVRGSRGGYGWAQWTGPRRSVFEKWCAENKLEPAKDEANYGFVLYELRGTFKTFSARMGGLRSIEDATQYTHEWYERPKDVLDGTFESLPRRLEYARRAFVGARNLMVGHGPEAPKPITQYLPARTLRVDEPRMTGEDVRKIQVKLITVGLDPGPVDGDFGPRTEAAVKVFQEKSGLDVDGIVGPFTWSKFGGDV